ncbi:rhamnosyltransferase [Collimonas sp. OK607]|uniref:glycosyltransferase n=1 Tax=Collimonas sp. OK607 TaxID=1798194 RepID=UPI0008E1DB5B|nr:glycosyltransferase [Collimonas sp. OK607]SFA80051.1 rhamnosyltransferase [Collimonas sp. OK607]
MVRNIAIGFVIYNPGNGLLSRIQMALELGYDIYIYDNSPQEESVRKFCDEKGKIKYLTGGKNLGLGLGVSSVCAQAYFENNSGLVFFDQDTIFNKDTLECIENYFCDHSELELTHSAVVFNSKKSKEKNEQNCFKDVPLAINSGSLFYLKNLKKLNWHNEKYFVDCVDYEFCFRSKRGGLRIGEYSCTPGFDHVTEQGDKKYKIFGKYYSMRAYSYSRILDASISSLRLIGTTLSSGDIKFSGHIIKFLLIYIIFQASVRFLNSVDEKKA